jgi:cob(I)alamin adenosyltransferase
MKIYTRTGDEGETGLFGGGRVAKSHRRVDAYGTVDELSAALGIAAGSLAQEEIREKVVSLQLDLFIVGSSLATPGAEDGSARVSLPGLPEGRIREMEGWIDQASEETPALQTFILPGGSPGASALHLARTVCRRAERAVVRLAGEEGVDPMMVRYLNRLSDLLFALARLENHRLGIPDTPWQKEHRP